MNYKYQLSSQLPLPSTAAAAAAVIITCCQVKENRTLISRPYQSVWFTSKRANKHSPSPKYEFHTLFLIFFIVIIFIQEKSLVFCSILAFFHFHHHHWSDTQAQAIISYDHEVTTTDSIFFKRSPVSFLHFKEKLLSKKEKIVIVPRVHLTFPTILLLLRKLTN